MKFNEIPLIQIMQTMRKMFVVQGRTQVPTPSKLGFDVEMDFRENDNETLWHVS